MKQKTLRGKVLIRPSVFIYTIVLTALCFTLFLGGAQASGWTLRSVSILILAIGVLGFFLLASIFDESVWSLPFLLFLIIFLYHAGLYIYPAVTGEPTPLVSLPGREWFSPALASRAGYLVSLGLVAYLIGCMLPKLKIRQQDPSEYKERDTDAAFNEAIGTIGGATTVISVLVWFWSSASIAGPLFFLGDYGTFLIRTADAGLGMTYLGIALGTAMIAQNHHGIMARLGLGAFVLFAVLGLPLGLRGEVMIPLVAGLVVYARTHRMPSVKFFVLGLTGVFFLFTGVKSLRQTGIIGLAESSDDGPAGNFFYAIEEMGATVRVLFTSMQWHEGLSEPFEGGATYLVPIQRIFQRVLWLERIPGDQDYGLMNVEVADRVGQIGGSMLGEAHHNFGAIGIMFVLFIVGFTAALFQTRKATPLSLALTGLFAVLALMHVRNSFAPIVSWVLIAGGLLITAFLYARVLMRSRSAETPSQVRDVPLK